MTQVLVLNASYEPLNVTSVRRAHVLVFKGKAEVIEELEQPLRSASDTYPWPHVIRLVQYVRVPRAVQRKISRRALFARDGWRCVYCGTTAGRLTLDHVVPRSRGGDSVWENVVTSCAPCNLKKGNRLARGGVDELQRPPRPPQPVLFIRLAAPKIPHGWRQYLPDSRLDRRRHLRRRLRTAAPARRPRAGGRASRPAACLERKVGALLPLAPRAGVELRVAAGEGKAMHRDGRRDAGAAVGDELARG